MNTGRTERAAGIVLLTLLLPSAALLLRVDPVFDTETFLATAYSSGSITRSGHPVETGMVAADPRVIPLGSRILVLGAGEYSGEYMVRDTGAKIKGRRIDIYVESRSEAIDFGAQRVEVLILDTPGEDEVVEAAFP